MSAQAVELGTRVSNGGGRAVLETVGDAKLVLLKEEVSLGGKIVATGEFSVAGAANVMMWVKVGGQYYFSKVPALMNVKDRDGVEFKIPFDAGNQRASEVLIQVEMLDRGSMEIRNFRVGN